MQASDIDEVLSNLNGIVDRSLRTDATIGYFSGLYLTVTWAIKRAVVAGNVFEDNERMAEFDTLFANRFLEAWSQYIDGEPPSSPWEQTFAALARTDLMVVQQLALGMNSHINLDLGIAAEQLMRERGEPLDDLQGDFAMVNTILTRLIGIVQVQLAELSTTFRSLEAAAPALQNHLFGLALEGLRDGAWLLAKRLDKKKTEVARQLVIAERSAVTIQAGKLILSPPGHGTFIAQVVAEEQENDVRHNIQIVAQ